MSSLRPSEHPRREQSFPQISQAQLAMYVGLASLSVLFLASLVAYFITRAQAEVWRTVELPHLPAGLWASTGVLFAQFAAMHIASRRIARNDFPGLSRGLLISLCFGLIFLLAQVQNWRVVAGSTLVAPVKSLYSYTFYMLTALHAIHVVAGVIPLFVIYRRSLAQEYSSSRHEGVTLVRQYWDFLLVVWVVLLAALWFT